MYNFIFFFIYSQQIQKEKSEAFSRWNGGLIVGVTLTIHLVFVASALRSSMFQNDYYTFTRVIGLVLKILALPLIILTPLYYDSDRVKVILDKRNGVYLPINMWNSIKILSLIFIPLIFDLILAKR